MYPYIEKKYVLSWQKLTFVTITYYILSCSDLKGLLQNFFKFFIVNCIINENLGIINNNAIKKITTKLRSKTILF